MPGSLLFCALPLAGARAAVAGLAVASGALAGAALAILAGALGAVASCGRLLAGVGGEVATSHSQTKRKNSAGNHHLQTSHFTFSFLSLRCFHTPRAQGACGAWGLDQENADQQIAVGPERDPVASGWSPMKRDRRRRRKNRGLRDDYGDRGGSNRRDDRLRGLTADIDSRRTAAVRSGSGLAGAATAGVVDLETGSQARAGQQEDDRHRQDQGEDCLCPLRHVLTIPRGKDWVNPPSQGH